MSKPDESSPVRPPSQLGFPFADRDRTFTEAVSLLGANREPTELDDGVAAAADAFAQEAATFIAGTEAVASGVNPGSAVSLLMLQLSSLLAHGARLGAQEDFVPSGSWEPDAGDEPEIDELRLALRGQLDPVDEYQEVFDPYVREEVVTSHLSDDLAAITGTLLHGLAHYAAGRAVEALWWWQYSYIADWGATASAALRAVQSLVSHVRLGNPMGEPGDQTWL